MDVFFQEFSWLHPFVPLIFSDRFQDLCKFMRGDLRPEQVNITIQNIIMYAIERVELRDEIFCQIMRQVTECPREDETDRGWHLLCLCCAAFAPGKSLNKVSWKSSTQAYTYVRGVHANICYKCTTWCQPHIRYRLQPPMVPDATNTLIFIGQVGLKLRLASMVGHAAVRGHHDPGTGILTWCTRYFLGSIIVFLRHWLPNSLLFKSQDHPHPVLFVDLQFLQAFFKRHYADEKWRRFAKWCLSTVCLTRVAPRKLPPSGMEISVGGSDCIVYSLYIHSEGAIE